ncbi:MAG: hypothetical protein H6R37_807, partial [Deltaproteobacteria bacterium]|nr:hypothetical protein [Deltaproteobacteria bacterium]
MNSAGLRQAVSAEKNPPRDIFCLDIGEREPGSK